MSGFGARRRLIARDLWLWTMRKVAENTGKKGWRDKSGATYCGLCGCKVKKILGGIARRRAAQFSDYVVISKSQRVAFLPSAQS